MVFLTNYAKYKTRCLWIKSVEIERKLWRWNDNKVKGKSATRVLPPGNARPYAIMG